MSRRDSADGQFEPLDYGQDARGREVTTVPSSPGARVSRAFSTDSPEKPEEPGADAGRPTLVPLDEYIESTGERRGESDLNRDQAASEDSWRPTGDPAYDWKVPDIGMSVEGTRHPSLRDAGTPTGEGVDREGNERPEPTDRVGSWTDTVVERRLGDIYKGVVQYTPQAYHHILGRRLTSHRELVRPEDLPARGVEVEAYHDRRGVRLPEKDEKAIKLGDKSAAELDATLSSRFEIDTAPTWGFSCPKKDYLADDSASGAVDRRGWDALASSADPAMLFSVRVSSGRYDAEASGPEYSPYAEPPLGSVWPEAKNQEWYLKGRQGVYLGFVEEETLMKLERCSEETHRSRCLQNPGASMRAERYWAGNRRVAAVTVEETGPYPEDSRIALDAAEIYDEKMWDTRERLRFAGRVAAVVGHEWETAAGMSDADSRFIEDVAEHYPVLATAVASIDPDSPLGLEPGGDLVGGWRAAVNRAIDGAVDESVRRDGVAGGPSVQSAILYGVGRYAEAMADRAESPVSLGPSTAGPEASIPAVRPASDLDPVAPRTPSSVVDSIERALSNAAEAEAEAREKRASDPKGPGPLPGDDVPFPTCTEEVAVLRAAADAHDPDAGAFKTTRETRMALQRIGGVLASRVSDVEDRIDLLKLHRTEPVDAHNASVRSEIIFTDRMTARLEGSQTPRAGSQYLRAADEEHLQAATAECAWHMARGALGKVAAAAEDVRTDRGQNLMTLDRADLIDAQGLSMGSGPDPISVAELQPPSAPAQRALKRSDYVEFCDRVVDVVDSVLSSERNAVSDPREVRKSVAAFSAKRDAMPVDVSIDEFEKVRNQGVELVRGVAAEFSHVVSAERRVPSPERAAVAQEAGRRVCSEFLRPGRFPADAEPVSPGTASRDPVEGAVARVWAAVGGPDAFRDRIAPKRQEPPKPSPERVAAEAAKSYTSLSGSGKVEAVPGLSPAEARRAVGASVAWRVTKSTVPEPARPAPAKPAPAGAGSPGAAAASADPDDRAARIARNRALYGQQRDVVAERRAVEKAAAVVVRHLQTSGRLDALVPTKPGPARGGPEPRAGAARGRKAASGPAASRKAGAKAPARSGAQASGARGASGSLASKRSAVVRRAGAAVGGAAPAAAGSRDASPGSASKKSGRKGSRG